MAIELHSTNTLFFPFRANKDTKPAVLVDFTGNPLSVVFTGFTDVGSQQVPSFVIAADNLATVSPYSYSAKNAKDFEEEIQFLSFLNDYESINNQPLCHTYKQQDKPDFLLDNNVGLELTRLSLFGYYEFIYRLESLLYNEPIGVFKALKNANVLISVFDYTDSLATEILKILKQIEIVGNIDVPDGNLDKNFTDKVLLTHEGKVQFSIVKRNSFFQNRLFLKHKLNISIQLQREITLLDIKEAFDKTIEAKDKPGNDILLISFGIPYRSGFRLSSDFHIFNFIVNNPSCLSNNFKYIKEVYLHNWGFGQYIKITNQGEIQFTGAPLYTDTFSGIVIPN